VVISIVAAVPTVQPRSEKPYSPSRAIPSQFAQADFRLMAKPRQVRWRCCKIQKGGRWDAYPTVDTRFARERYG
jgi:hypothetical protein